MKSDRSWSPDQADLDWIESTGRPPHPVFLDMEEAATGLRRIPILSRESGRVLGVLVEIHHLVGDRGFIELAHEALAVPTPGRGVNGYRSCHAVALSKSDLFIEDNDPPCEPIPQERTERNHESRRVHR